MSPRALRSLQLGSLQLRSLQLLLAVLLALAGLTIGERYISRLPDHAGYYLVPVDDVVASPAPARPRHTVVVVADGLGERFARALQVTARLQAAGQCRPTDVGTISVSRPVYAVISTGLEQDRTGVRNNDERDPLAAESIWDVAREAGLRVVAAAEVPWWLQLFPRGFERFDVVPDALDPFAVVIPGDLMLVHPAYIDHAGHAEGADSPAYAAAVARLDREFGALLDRLDLERDLVVFTADHGHAGRGGHGGRAPEIAQVLTCFAGRGVARRAGGDAIHSHAIAGTLAVLLGLRFPRHMRAVEDDLDLAFTIVDPDLYPAAYLADRRRAVDRFRAENSARLAGWLGQPGAWSDLEARDGRRQALRAGLFALLTLAGFLVLARLRRHDRRRTLELALWGLALVAASVALHVVVLGSFDWTAINTRERYLRAGPLVCLLPALLALLLRRRRDGLVGDQLTLAGLALALDLGHIGVFGWPLGYPLPGPALLLVPFFASIFLVVHALLAALLAAAALLAMALAPVRARLRA